MREKIDVFLVYTSISKTIDRTKILKYAIGRLAQIHFNYYWKLVRNLGRKAHGALAYILE